MASNWRAAGVVVALCLSGDIAPVGAGLGQPELTPVVVIGELQWLEGVWQGTAGQAHVEERWTSPEGGAMLGMGRTIRDGRMVAFEFLRIVPEGGRLVYVAQPGGRPPTEFPMTSGGPGYAVFENPAHDYTKVIRYTRKGDLLTAETEGAENGKPSRETLTFNRAK